MAWRPSNLLLGKETNHYKNPEYVEEVEEDGAIIELVTYSGIGYTFLGTNSISNHSHSPWATRCQR